MHKKKMDAYLQASKYIDFNDGLVAAKATELAASNAGDRATAQACYRFVRDEIQHSWDYGRGPVTCKASDVLRHRTGYCYAKSHLLAALLRANGIPAGLCYQRLSVEGAGPPYCLHGLNAVYLSDYGWFRCDARGNNARVSTTFGPPSESLAFAIREKEERTLPEIWAEPLPIVTATLERYDEVALVHKMLPDIPLMG